MKFEQAFKIGQCQVIPIEYAIQFDQQAKQSIQPKFIEVLCYLAQHFPRVIPRDELIDNVWAGNSYVGEKALTNAIWHLRQNLKTDEHQNETIETIRKVGYRLLVTPEFDELDSKNTLQNSSTNDKQIFRISSLANSALYAFLFLTCGLIIWQYLFVAPKIQLPIVKQITKAPGSELFVSPSPSGRFIVYKWLHPDKVSDLFLHDNLQPQLPPKQLTFDSDDEGISVWSHDEQYLYYARKNLKQNYCMITQLKVSTNQTKSITECPAKNSYDYIDISPDDETLAFQGYSPPADDSGIYFISLIKEGAKPIRFSCSNDCGYRDRDMSFSPDGKKIAVTRRVNRFNENIYLVDIESKIAKQLTDGEEDIVGMTWHPNGKSIVYGTQRADVRHGYTLNLADKRIQALNIEAFSFPNFSSKTGELFYQQRAEKYHIASLQLDNKLAAAPFPVIQSDFNHHYPHYSSITKRIAYVSNESGFYELWSADKFGANRKQLTNLRQSIRYPHWSNNGEKIAFLAPVEGEDGDKIYIFDTIKQKLSIVPSLYKKHNRPTWSFDDKAIISAIYTDEFTDLHQISLTDGFVKRLTFDGGRYGLMTSPTTLLYTRIKDGLWQKDITSKAPPLIKIDGESFNATYTWSLSDEGVYFRYNSEDNHQISHMNFSTFLQTPIIRLPLKTFARYGGLTFIPEFNKLLFTASHFPQADIKKLSHPLIEVDD